ncbi:MAG: M16 family metallopeptidase, partial [bacterium]
YLTFRLLSRDLFTGLDLLAEMVLEPSFPIDELTRVQEQALANALRAYDNPATVIGMEFDRLLFGPHRFSLPPQGDTTTLQKITCSDLQNFHKTHFVPNNCFIVVVGAVDHLKIKQEISRRFAGWRSGPVPEPKPLELYLPEKTRVKLITRKEMNQTYIQFGHPGISIYEQDIIPTRLMSYILGGPPLSSRMGLAVREYGGLAYDVRCWFDRRSLPGAFRATVQTAKPKEAIEKMFAEITRMCQTGADKSELLKAQNYFIGSFPLSYSSNQGKLNRVIELELYHLGTNWLTEFPEKVQATTLAQVNEAAKRHLYPNHYIVVIMGNITKDELNLTDVEWIE